jgi:hypothetical protein
LFVHFLLITRIYLLIGEHCSRSKISERRRRKVTGGIKKITKNEKKTLFGFSETAKIHVQA